MRGVSADAREIFRFVGLLSSDDVHLEQLGKTENRVDGRAELVTHRCEESRLRLIRRVGRLARGLPLQPNARALERLPQLLGEGANRGDVVIAESLRLAV